MDRFDPVSMSRITRRRRPKARAEPAASESGKCEKVRPLNGANFSLSCSSADTNYCISRFGRVFDALTSRVIFCLRFFSRLVRDQNRTPNKSALLEDRRSARLLSCSPEDAAGGGRKLIDFFLLSSFVRRKRQPDFALISCQLPAR